MAVVLDGAVSSGEIDGYSKELRNGRITVIVTKGSKTGEAWSEESEADAAEKAIAVLADGPVLPEPPAPPEEPVVDPDAKPKK